MEAPEIAGNPIRVLLVDDHEIVRRGARTLLEPEPDIVVAGEARGVREAVEVAAATRPDVVITELDLPDGSGLEAVRDILSAHPRTQVLILTSSPDEQALVDSVLAGARGFLLKQVRSAELVRSIRRLASGHSLVDPVMTRSLLDRLRGGKRYWTPSALASLSPQEERILDRLGEGRSSRAIGAELHLTEKTVRNYASRIFSKLGVGSRAEGVAYLARHKESGPSQ
jgi:DNA-binding NarL/FixJ family response regulator